MDHPVIDRSADGGRVMVPRGLLELLEPDHYILRVVGDSMLLEHILDGDYAVIDRRDPKPGEAVVALIGDEASIKRWYPEGESARLVPMDPALEPIVVLVGDVKVKGVVVGLMRRF